MKTLKISFSQKIITILFMTISTLSFSQKTVVWKGGTPGMEQQWDCAKNWSTHSVPDEFSDVLIPDVSSTTQATPIIRSGKVAVNSIFLESDALLSVQKNAMLTVYGHAQGVYVENLQLQGALHVIYETDENSNSTAFTIGH